MTDRGTRAAYKHFLPLQTRWADNDIYGHVNNVAYYGYFDTIVNEYLIAAGALDIHATMAVYTQIGLISIGVGVFINTIIEFIIVAFALFIVIKGMNKLKKKEEEKPEEPKEPTAEEVLLTEIRDILKAQGK